MCFLCYLGFFVFQQVSSLEGLERFLALGTLDLSTNDIEWAELGRIQHLHILILNLHGNPNLEKDVHCMPFIKISILIKITLGILKVL